jgi:hypothetical protein
MFAKSLWAAAFATAAIVGAAPASATMITYDSYSVVNNVNVTINYTGIGAGPYGSGQIDTYLGNTLVAKSWCIDVSHDLLGSGVWNVIGVVNNAGMSNVDNGGGNGTLLSWQTLGEMGALAAYGNLHINDNANISSAIQLAIWSVEYGSAITVTSASPSVQALANTLIFDATHGLLGYDTDVAWLMYCNSDHHCNQGQLVVLDNGDFRVPEPSTLAIFAAGMLGAAGLGLRRKRKPSATN